MCTQPYFLVQTERAWRWVLLSTPPGSCFPLGIEEDSSNREFKVIVLGESSSAEVIPCGWWMDCLPSLLLEQCEHKSVYSYVGPWYLISHHLPSCAFAQTPTPKPKLGHTYIISSTITPAHAPCPSNQSSHNYLAHEQNTHVYKAEDTVTEM